MQEKGAYTPGMPGRAKVNIQPPRDNEKSTQIMVPDKTVGLIIGRGGETIKDLQERSGCHVNIVGENKSINGLRPVNPGRRRPCNSYGERAHPRDCGERQQRTHGKY